MKKEEIQNAALNIFAHKGFAESTMNEIADVVGLKKATLYFYFKSKDELHSVIMKEIANSYLAVIENTINLYRNQTFEKILLEIFIASIEASTKEKLLLWKKTILASLSSPEDDSFRIVYRRFNISVLKMLFTVLVKKTDSPKRLNSFLYFYYLFVQSFLDWMILNSFKSKNDIVKMAYQTWDRFWNGNKLE